MLSINRPSFHVLEVSIITCYVHSFHSYLWLYPLSCQWTVSTERKGKMERSVSVISDFIMSNARRQRYHPSHPSHAPLKKPPVQWTRYQLLTDRTSLKIEKAEGHPFEWTTSEKRANFLREMASGYRKGAPSEEHENPRYHHRWNLMRQRMKCRFRKDLSTTHPPHPKENTSAYCSKCDHSGMLRICCHMYFSNLLADLA